MHVVLYLFLIVLVGGAALYIVSRLPAFVDWGTLARFPSTNGRIASTLVLSAIYVLTLLLLLVLDKPINAEVAAILGMYLAASGGFDYAQFKKKRETEFRGAGEMTTAEHRAAAPPAPRQELKPGEVAFDADPNP